MHTSLASNARDVRSGPIRRRDLHLIKHISLSATLAVVIGIAGAPPAVFGFPGSPENDSHAAAVADGYTAEELVDGIVFNNGSVAEDLGIVVERPASMTATDHAEDDEAVEVLRASMLAADGARLEQAAVQLVSCDPYQVEAALDAYGSSLNTALDVEYPGVRQDGDVVTPMCAAIAVVTFNVAGGVNIVYEQNGFWNNNSFTPARSTTDYAGPTASTAFSETATVRALTTALEGR